MSDHPALLQALAAQLGAATVLTDAQTLQRAASDLYASGPLPLAVVRPADPAQVQQLVAEASSHDVALVPRGGGLSYTGGYTGSQQPFLLVDLSALDRIEHIDADDMYVIVQAGVSWKQLYDALAPLGLRTPYFGTFSGAGASIGGGLSHGALFFGSARYGSAADNVLALELVTADGQWLRTGQWAWREPALPVFRGYGPDPTDLFLHDGGAFGIKTRAALRLIRTPAHSAGASFAFAGFEAAGKALSAIAREGLAEETYVLDPGAMAMNLERERTLRAAWTALRQVTRASPGLAGKARALASLAAGGRTPVPANAFSLHLVAAGNSPAAVEHDLGRARALARQHGGVAIAPSVPRIARANPFPGLDAVLGASGARWAALNCKLAHSQAAALITAHQALVARHAQALHEHGVRVTWLCSALFNHSFSFEAVFHWHDQWQPTHAVHLSPQARARLQEPAANPQARALVASLREETCALFVQMGAASNQIGRTYPYLDNLAPPARQLLQTLKQQLDPARRMNPGVLGL